MPRWSWKNSVTGADDEPIDVAPASKPDNNATHLDLAKQSLRELLEDPRIPAQVRETLADDYTQVQAMLDKLEHGHVHIAVFGRVSVGKSAMLNALLGHEEFGVSALHGKTTKAQLANWQEVESGGVFLIDTPGINEISGEERERIAHEVAGRSDLVLFVVDGDLTETEHQALKTLSLQNRPMLLVLNKVDRYTAKERDLLLENLRERTAGLVSEQQVVTAAALPAEKVYIYVDDDGSEREVVKSPPAQIGAVKEHLWRILEQEGMTLAALNASLFAGNLSDQVAGRILEVKKTLTEKVVRSYCITKGVAIALNPIPIADLLAASAVDAGMIVHLSRIYGMDITRKEAGRLIRTIGGQMALLAAAIVGVNVISSLLKAGSGGLSTVVTGGAQGVVGYYSTYVVGRAAERYFAQGKSWGDKGPKRVVQEILDNVDRNSILEQAREDIFTRLKGSQKRSTA
ncbi:MAG: GTP-binding protein [Chromatiales bacterium]|nr:GTP-binding protein [Chromatiales bacterium]